MCITLTELAMSTSIGVIFSHYRLNLEIYELKNWFYHMLLIINIIILHDDTANNLTVTTNIRLPKIVLFYVQCRKCILDIMFATVGFIEIYIKDNRQPTKNHFKIYLVNNIDLNLENVQLFGLQITAVTFNSFIYPTKCLHAYSSLKVEDGPTNETPTVTAIEWPSSETSWLTRINHGPFADMIYRKTSNIRHTFVGNKIVDHSDVVGASPVGAAPTTSSFST